MLKATHDALFEGLVDRPYDFSYRDFNISKREAVLSGRPVAYARWQMIADDLACNFEHSEPRSAKIVRDGFPAALDGSVRFEPDVGQVRPFVEGNTRTTAALVEMALRNAGP